MDIPKIINLSSDLEWYIKRLQKEIIDRDNATTHFVEGMKEDRVRQLLKTRVKRIRII